MVEVKVTIASGSGSTTYSVVVPDSAEEAAAAQLGKAIELGCALLSAPFCRKETNVDVEPRTVQ